MKIMEHAGMITDLVKGSEPLIKRVLLFLLNPFLLAFWTLIILVLIRPVKNDKYIAVEAGAQKVNAEQKLFFYDLNGDGTSEELFLMTRSPEAASLFIKENDILIDQWNLYGTFGFSRNGWIIFGDYNNDRLSEVYVFTISNDSVYLNCIGDYKTPGFMIRKKFIASCAASDVADHYIVPAEMEDLNGDGSKELVFGIGSGYSVYPRRVYVLDIKNNVLKVSPPATANILGITQKDINGDGVREIMPWGYSCSNAHDSAALYHDRSCWLMALEGGLDFLFPPSEFKGRYCNLIVLDLFSGNTVPAGAAAYYPGGTESDSAFLFSFDSSGKIINERKIENFAGIALIVKSTINGNRVLTCTRSGALNIYDSSFTKITTVPCWKGAEPVILDIDNDGNDEILVADHLRAAIRVFANDLSHELQIIPETNEDIDESGFQIIIKKNAPRRFSIRSGVVYYDYVYKINPRFRYRYFYFLAIYVAILLFILLVRKIQQAQIKKRRDTENKINRLQLQIVRNQLDPHFTMNAINSIVAAIEKERRDEAREHLVCFSRLHRSMLLSSDTIFRSLEEEIDFTKDYLALEKFRYKERLDYVFEIDPSLDTSILIPGMILQVHVENAVKHGLSSKSDGGRIVIRCREKGAAIKLEIEDNGVGRLFSSARPRESTGKGLSTIEQLALLYYKINKTRISTEISDLTGRNGNPSGTRVTITITRNQLIS